MTLAHRTRNFLLGVALLRDRMPSWDAYPDSIPAITHLGALPFDQPVTFLVGAPRIPG